MWFFFVLMLNFVIHFLLGVLFSPSQKMEGKDIPFLELNNGKDTPLSELNDFISFFFGTFKETK